MTIDILPTVAKLIGARLPDHTIDGLDISDLLLGKPGAESPHDALYFYWNRELQAMRSGRWSLHFPHAYRSLGGRTGGTGGQPVKYETGKTELALFDLHEDVGQRTDVADQHPQVVRRLQALADKMRDELGDGPRNKPGRGARPPGSI